MKKLLCSVENTEDLLRIERLLNEHKIPFISRPKPVSFIRSVWNLIFYHVLATGTERPGEPLGIYVEEEYVERAETVFKSGKKKGK